jgi:hypothetical protein
MKYPGFALLTAALVFANPIQLSAETPAPSTAPISVAQVELAGKPKSSYARLGGESWLEIELELEVKPGGKVVSGEYVNRVRTILSLGLEVTDKNGVERLVFYKSSAEAIALEGGKARIRFYLPPELVKRDKIKADFKYYGVELEVGGEPQAPARANYSNDFKSADSIKGFQAKVAAESGVNEGLLMPQYLTPFYGDTQRPAPTFLRRESQR